MMVSIIIIIIIIIIHTIIAITITTALIVLLKSLVMITLAVFSLLLISSMTATPRIMTSVPSNIAILILSLPFFVMPFLYGDNLYYYVIQPRRFFWSHASNKTTYHHHVCTRGQLRGLFCLQMGGGCAPSNPPRFSKAMDACQKKKQGSGRRQHRCLQKTSIRSSPWIIHVLHLGKATRVILFANGGGCAPPTSALFKGRRCLKLSHFHYFHCFS